MALGFVRRAYHRKQFGSRSMTNRTLRRTAQLSSSRRQMLQIGGLGLLGLSMSNVPALRAQSRAPATRDKSVLLIYLPGGLSHIDSFDPKPDAPADTGGEFDTIGTRTAGVRICEHLPGLAACSDIWSLVRSMGHPTNDHTQAHHYMLCGKMELPAPFDRAKPVRSDYPSMAAIAGSQLNSQGPTTAGRYVAEIVDQRGSASARRADGWSHGREV